MSPPRETLAPRFWPLWLGIGLFRLLGLLPLPAALTIGRGLGWLALRLSKRRRRITAINLQLCFPEKSEEERRSLLRAHFEALGMGLAEVAQAWWGSPSELAARMEVRGLEYMKQELAQGRGALVVVAHFTTLEIAPRLAMLAFPDMPANFHYRPHENPLIEHLIVTCRRRLFRNPITRGDIRGMVRALRKGEVVWYTLDQNYDGKGYVFSKFFGVPAATNTALTRLARMSHAAVIPFAFRRRPDGRYLLDFGRPLEEFPGASPQADTDRINRMIEGWVRAAPEQYFWLHRRFKSRPPGEPPIY